MRYRKLDANGDYSFGHGKTDFFINVPDAPAQAVQTRLNLWLGDWYLDTSDGMDWRSKVLGKYTGDIRDVAIQQRILGTPNVTEIVTYSSALNRGTRAFSVSGTTINTAYGQKTIAEPK